MNTKTTIISEEQLETQQHAHQGKVEVGAVSYQWGGYAIGQVV